MAIFTVRLDGAGDFTSVTAALAVAVNPGDVVSITQAGTYPNESWTGLTAPSPSVTIRNTSGGTVTVEDVAGRTTYFLTCPATALTLERLSFSLTTSGAGNGIYWGNLNGSTLTLNDCSATRRDAGAAGYGLIRNTVAGGRLVTNRCSVPTTTSLPRHQFLISSAATQWDDVGSTIFAGTSSPGYLWAPGTGCTGSWLRTRCSATRVLYLAGSANGTYTFDDVYSGGGLSTQASGTVASIIARACGTAHATTPLVNLSAGAATLSSLTIEGCYAGVLVGNSGTITAFSGAHNVYVSTAVGTTSATDRTVAAVADYRLGGPSTIEPRAGSALLDVIPVGVDYGASAIDQLGFPRLEGGRQTCGPVQARLPRGRPAWRRAVG